MATIKDVAKLAGVSISTVSKAFSNSTDISDKAREKVLKCALELGYNTKKQSKKTNGTILILVKRMDFKSNMQFGYEVLFGFQTAANNYNYQVDTVFVEDNNNVSYEEMMKSKHYVGSFVLGMNLTDTSLIQELEKTTKPTVLLDNIVNNNYVAQVGCDNKIGVELAVEHLVKLGHKRIAYFGGEACSNVSQERKNAFYLAMTSKNLDPSLIEDGDFFQDYAPLIVPKFLACDVSAIVCASDLIAINVIKELNKLEKVVPDDISVIGFDNIPLANNCNPKLTSVSQDSLEIGKSGFYALKQLIDGVKIGKILLRPELVVRQSTTKY